MVQFSATAVLLAAAALLQSGYAQVSTVTVYRSSACSAVYTTSSTSSTPSESSSIQPSTSAIPDNAANGGTPFIIQVQPPPGSFTRKRQAQSVPIYITGSGQTTTELAQAQRYVISDGRLLGATGGQVSTSLDALNAPLAISTTVQNITVSFTARNGNVRWANPAFDSGTVSFYASAAGQIISRFNGPIDPTWSAVVLDIQPLSGPPASTSSASLSTSTASSVTSGVNTWSSTTSTSSVSISGGGGTPGTPSTLSSSSTSTSSRVSFGYDPSTSSSASYSYAPNNSSPPGSSYSTSTRSSSLSSVNTSTLPTISTPGQPIGPVNPTFSSSTTFVESSSTVPTTSSSSVLIPTPAPVPTSSSASTAPPSSSSAASSVTSPSSSTTTTRPSSTTPYTRLTSPTACDFGDPPNIDQDDNYCIVDLPFNVTFYNTQSSSTTYPNTNGLLCLNSGSQAYLPSTLPVKIFNAQPFPESCIFPFWEDLFLAGTSDPKQGVYYQLNEDETAVTYEWLAGRGGFADAYNFQLFYDSATPGVFTMRYGDVGGGDNGSSALVGVQGVDASGQGVSATYAWGEGNITPDLTVVCDTNTNTCTSS